VSTGLVMVEVEKASLRDSAGEKEGAPNDCTWCNQG
jgi:hypothetical protein